MVAQGEIVLGHVERSAGNFDAARDRFARCLEHFQSRAIPWAPGNALAGMAAIALATGDTREAERLVDEATSSLQPRVRGSCTWDCTFGPSWRCGAGSQTRRSG